MKPVTALWVIAAVLAAALPLSMGVGDPLDRLRATVRLERPLKEAIPTEHRGWRMLQEDELREYELEITKVDDYVSRLYAGPAGARVLLYLAYHGNKERGMDTLYHNASICYPAAGWNLASERFEDVTLHDIAKVVPTCRYLFERGSEKITVLTFFKVDDELLDQSPRNKPFWMLAEKLTPDLDDSPGTFVQAQLVVPVGDDRLTAEAHQRRFLQDFGTAIFQAIP